MIHTDGTPTITSVGAIGPCHCIFGAVKENCTCGKHYVQDEEQEYNVYDSEA